MNRTGEPSVAELIAQLAANAAEIAALKAEKDALAQRVGKEARPQTAAAKPAARARRV